MIDWNGRYASRMKNVVASDIREKMKLLGQRNIIHLGGGLPDPALFPEAALADAASAILNDSARARQALSYAPSEGHAPLRQWVADYQTRRGAACSIDNVMITNGSQQGLDFVARLFLAPGDPVMVEIPAFVGALRAFDAYEPRYVPLGRDTGDAKFAYVGTEFCNPTGLSMTAEHRQSLIDVARERGMPVLEDGCYEQLRYEGESLPPLFVTAAQQCGGVEQSPFLHAGSFSKIIAPSLRIGWLAGPAEVIRKLVLIKQAADLATSALNQMLALEVLEGGLDEHLAMVRQAYRERRDSMLAALSRHMPAGVEWTSPEGGLYVWVTFPEGFDAAAFAERVLLEREVSVVAGQAFHPQTNPIDPGCARSIRLSFSMIDAEQAAEGVARFGELARLCLAAPN
ncbi:hypothetical protein MB02_07330 [Croceicoccus estronivorus]|uniref:aminotransferase-like domain-containing protein n=1 Tax=Croceicoccus estronivorus TaxID=1172626 RepID=UPI00083388FE|nr:PLP-dependent aminotransferase family protein [Croceicoccus estronivorus]OCC24385.1 hypothetical protein MB02_07330 [Croceicoccus estronivorus]